MTTDTSTPPGTDSGLPPLDVGARCPDCDYDLRGSTSARCSECGFDLHLLRTQESQIPWVHRARLGRWRAYWRTVAYVIFRPRRFAIELNRPVSPRDARRFWLVTWLHVVATLAAGFGAMAYHALWYDTPAWADGSGIVGLLIALWLSIVLGPAPFIAAAVFRSAPPWDERQDRAAALSLYAWAPFAGVLLSAVCVVLTMLLGDAHLNAAIVCGLLVPGTWIVVVAATERTLAGLLKTARGLRGWPGLGCELWLNFVLLLWILLSLLVPVGGLYVWYILESLRGL